MKKVFKLLLCFYFVTIGLVFTSCSDYIQDNEERFLKELQAAPFGNDNRELIFTIDIDDSKTKERWDYFDKVGFDHESIMDSYRSTWLKAKICAYKVSDEIPHKNPPEKDWNSIKYDCFSLWEYGTKKGMNCKMHAYLLSEILTSMGVQNRFVRCLPYNYNEYQECHVVNEVWLPEYNKWAMIDSDMNEYVVNENEIPMSLREMREWIIAEKPLIFRPITEKKLNKKYLQAYWTKNLYFLQSPCSYSYDVYKQDTCFIIPEGKENVLEETYELDTETFTRWTTNADTFWAPPAHAIEKN